MKLSRSLGLYNEGIRRSRMAVSRLAPVYPKFDEENMMSFRSRKLEVYVTSALLLVSLSLPVFAGEKKAAKKDSGKQTLTGVVSDSMCGAHHMMENAADCTRACISKGSKYALVVGDKVYTLDTEDKAALDELNKRAGEKAKVTGTVNGDNIQVTSVAGA